MVGDDLASFSSSYPVFQASSFSAVVFLTLACLIFLPGLSSLLPILGDEEE